MQCDINSLPGPRGVLGVEIQKRIKCRGRVRVQERITQSGLAYFAYRQVLSLVPRVTETHFPIPRLEVIPKFAHLTAQSDVEELVPVSEFFVPRTSVVNAAKPNASGHRDWHPINNQSRISNCEGIERIRDWHTDARRTKERVSGGGGEGIRRSGHSGQRRSGIRARLVEVCEYGEVFVAYVARERAVVYF